MIRFSLATTVSVFPNMPFESTHEAGTPSRSPAQTLKDDADERTIAGSVNGREAEHHHHLANIDVPPSPEELKKEGFQDEDDFPDGGMRAWLVVLGGACLTFGT